MNYAPLRKMPAIEAVLTTLSLAAVGALLNYRLPLDLAFGISVLAGNILAILAICLTRHPLSVFAPMISMLPTLFMWGHPWALASYLLEGILVYRLVSKARTEDIIWAEALFWPLLGIPLIIGQYSLFLGMNLQGAVAAAVKQGVNAIFNATSGLLLFYLGSFLVTRLINLQLRSPRAKTGADQPPTWTLPPKAREYLLIFVNISLILPFFTGIFIFVRNEKNNIILAAASEASLVLETLGETLSAESSFEPSASFKSLSGLSITMRTEAGDLLWATDSGSSTRQSQHSRILNQAHNSNEISIRTNPDEKNPMKAWQTAMVYGTKNLADKRRLIVEQSFAPAVAKMNNEITVAFLFLLLWLAGSSSIARAFTNFLMGPLEKLRINAEKLQRDPTQELIWPVFRIMEIKELRDSLVAMTGVLTNRSVELQEAQRTAQRMLLQSERYLAFLGHELKAPLSAMYSTLEMLAEQPMSCSDVLESIKDSAYNLIQLINDIIDQASAHSGSLQFHDIQFNLARETRLAMETFVIQARRKGLEMIINIDSALDREIWWDKVRYRQVLSNLASNAIKYTESGFIRLRLDADLSKPGQLLLKGSIEDSGRGIAEDRLPYIWEPFAMARGRTTELDSSHGLGLSIVKSILQSRSGSIRVKSRLAEGSIFSFALPLPFSKEAADEIDRLAAQTPDSGLQAAPNTLQEPVQTAATPVPAAPAKPSTTAKTRPVNAAKSNDTENNDMESSKPPLAGIPTLLIDDERLSRMAIGYMLRSRGAVVEESESGDDALKRVQEKDYHLIFVDQNMPGLSGLDTAAAIRRLEQENKRKPALIILSSADHNVQSNPDISIILPKPLSSEDLEQAIRLLSPDLLHITK
ncbi:MAG: hybrid sensor histidine kinase/response regulator [Spirochaetes bacterium]|nr:hybrid sensor histidine kinase/response regulator [Spirochaetota bacterium]MBU0955244.1 hybrid sensor histidine kinase/response regulator [Spirochaetota bacterium]